MFLYHVVDIKIVLLRMRVESSTLPCKRAIKLNAYCNPLFGDDGA